MNKFRKPLIYGVLCTCIIFGFQNCGEGFKVLKQDSKKTLLSSAVCTDAGCNNVDFDQAELSTFCIFDGRQVENGSGIIAFLNGNTQECQAEYRECKSGELSGSYLYGQCQTSSTARLPSSGDTSVYGDMENENLSQMAEIGSDSSNAAEPCIFDGKKVANGSGIIAYLEAKAAECLGQYRKCEDGKLAGSYLYASCRT